MPNYIPADAARFLHWAEHSDLRVFIHPGINNVVDKTPASNIDPVRARKLVRDALDAWTAASTADFGFSIVDSPEGADIQIYFVDALRRLDGSAASGVGLANYSFRFPNSGDTTHGILEGAVLQIGVNQPAENLPDTIAHEMGHALGIEVHSDVPSDLLFATSQPPIVITQRDQNTAFFLYYSPSALGGRSTGMGSTASAPQTTEITCPVK